MGLNQKYGDCGCGERTRGNPNHGLVNCCGAVPQRTSIPGAFCNGTPQTAPSPCCEAHETKWRTSICYRPIGNVVTNDETFYLTFVDNQINDIIPLNAAEMYLYHGAAGFMRVLGYNGNSYQVQLVDPTRAGAIINQGDCIYPSAQMNPAGVVPQISRCLSGYFSAPALNQDATIYILNGSGIPTGAVVTFTADGETGSYEVKQYVSGTGNISSYLVTNTGAGHVPGTIFNGGEDSACTVPIEVISDVDICNLSTAQNADTLTACVNGSPRGFESQGEGYVPVGTADNKWIQQRLSNTDCCVITDGVLKFTTPPCPGGYDQVILRDVNLSCFQAAFDLAIDASQPLAMNIGGLPVIVTSFNSGTRLATVVLASNDPLSESIEYPAGTQICLGDCCKGCTTGTIITPEETRSMYKLAMAHPTGESFWLVGFNNTDGSTVALQLDAAYWAASQSNVIGLPRFDDPMVMRQKICNISPKGCSQKVKMIYNYQLLFGLIASDAYIDWEIGQLSQEAATLKDNITVNPFSEILSLTKVSGRVIGPTLYDTDAEPSSFSGGFKGHSKNYPHAHGSVESAIFLNKCNCALSITWLMFRLNTSSSGSLDVELHIKRALEYDDYNYRPLPVLSNVSEGFAV